MWERVEIGRILELKPDQEIKGILPEKLRIIELTGSGEGHFILGENFEDFYNSLGTRWTVHSINMGPK